MADFPSLPLWTDAYLADTTDLSAEEHGVYLLLLMAAWRTPTCSLPDDDTRLARMAKIGPKKWRRMRPVMERFFTVEAGQWTQNRLLKERDRVEKSRNQKSQAAHAKHDKDKKTRENSFPSDAHRNAKSDNCDAQIASGKPLNSHKNGSAAASAEGLRNACNPEPEPYPDTKETTKEGASAPPRDDWNDDASLYRRGVGILGNSQRAAITQLKKQCADIFEARQILEQAAAKEHPSSWIYSVIKRKRSSQQQRDRPTQGQIAAG